MKVAAIVAAAGRGERLGAATPKALQPVGGVPLLVHAVLMLVAAGVDRIVVTAPAAAVDAFAALVPEAEVVVGGATRQASVGRGLTALGDEVDVVLVHDAARGLAPTSVTDRVLAALRAGADAVVPAVPLADTVKQVDADGRVVATVDRSRLRAVQTPQGFRRDVLIRAHAAATTDEATDDAALAESLGVSVVTVPGAAAAMKVTTREDLVVAESLLAERGDRVR